MSNRYRLVNANGKPLSPAALADDVCRDVFQREPDRDQQHRVFLLLAWFVSVGTQIQEIANGNGFSEDVRKVAAYLVRRGITSELSKQHRAPQRDHQLRLRFLTTPTLAHYCQRALPPFRFVF